MSLIDGFKPFYHVQMKCTNCGKVCDIRIKKGTKVSQAVRNNQIKCENCGCVIEAKEYQTQWLK